MGYSPRTEHTKSAMDPKVKELALTLNRPEAIELLKLLVETHPMSQPTDFRQEMWIAAYLDNHCSVAKACKAIHISPETYKLWCKEPNFQTRLTLAEKSVADRLMTKAMEKALGGDTDLLKFLLAAMDPERFDSKFRAQIKANEGQIAAITESNRIFTDEEIRVLLKSDPAQQYVPKTEPGTKH